MQTDKTPAPAAAQGYARGARTLRGHIRRRLQARPSMTRAELRASLRAAGLISAQTRGGHRLSCALWHMAQAGEIRCAGDLVEAIALRCRRPRSMQRAPLAPAIRHPAPASFAMRNRLVADFLSMADAVF